MDVNETIKNLNNKLGNKEISGEEYYKEIRNLI